MHLSSGGGFFLALSAARHVGARVVHNGARYDPGWALWRMLWAFKVARAWYFRPGSVSTQPEPYQAPDKLENEQKVFEALLRCTSIYGKYHTSPQLMYILIQSRYKSNRASRSCPVWQP